jgi:hypothetical protein
VQQQAVDRSINLALGFCCGASSRVCSISQTRALAVPILLWQALAHSWRTVRCHRESRTAHQTDASRATTRYRFAQYGKLIITSATGMNEEYMVSNVESAEAFARAWQSLASAVRAGV